MNSLELANEAANEALRNALEARDDKIKGQHARGLELAKALAVCIEAIAPADRGGISMHEWNKRLKTAQKLACAVLSVKDTGATDE